MKTLSAGSLVITLSPVPNESLSGLLHRLRVANGYTESGWYTTLLGGNSIRPNLLRAVSSYRALSELVGLDTATLYGLTLHRFMPAYFDSAMIVQQRERKPSEIDKPLWDVGLGHQFVDATFGKICPLCWQEHNTLLAQWSLVQTTACPRHGALLVNRCPSCKHPFHARFNKAGQLLCSRCKEATYTYKGTTNLEATGATTAINDPLTELLWRAVDCSGSELVTDLLGSYSKILPEGHILRSLSISSLLWFLYKAPSLLLGWGLDTVLSEAQPEIADTLRGLRNTYISAVWNLETATLHSVMNSTWQFLWEWPARWYTLLEQIAEREKRIGDGLSSRSGSFLYFLATTFPIKQWSWLHTSLYEFVDGPGRGRCPSYWLPHAQRAAAINHAGLMTLTEACTRLGISHKKALHLVENRVLTAPVPMDWSKSKRGRIILIDARSVKRLQTLRGKRLNVAQAASFLGIHTRRVIELARVGLLRADRARDIDPTRYWSFTYDELDEFLQTVVYRQPILPLEHSLPDPQGILTLNQALARAYAVRLTLSDLIHGIQSGKLSVFQSAGKDAASLKSLRFHCSTLVSFIDQVCLSRHSLLSAPQVCRILGCATASLRKLEGSGLLQLATDRTSHTPLRTRSGRYYDSCDVKAFMDRYIETNEAAALLDIQPGTLKLWVRIGKLSAVRGHGRATLVLDKMELLRWRDERLTVLEAAKALGVSAGTLKRWRRKGRVHPLPEKLGKQQCFARTEIEALYKSLHP